MKTYVLSAAFASSGLSNQDLITIGINPVSIDADDGGQTVQVSVMCDGASLGTEKAGDNAPIKLITPSQLPKAVAGARFFGVLSGLDWAEKHLSAYEYFSFTDSTRAGSTSYYVSGILNVTTDDGYDPLDATNGGSVQRHAICQGVSGEMFD